MALFKFFCALLLTTTFPILASFPTEVGGQMLYLLHRGEIEKAFVHYLSHTKEANIHDFDLLQMAAKSILEQGISSEDPETRLMCIFGAGVVNSPEMLPILEKGIKSPDVKIQLTALTYLARQQDDDADLILLDALSSPFLITRLEALLQLAKKNHPSVLGHLHSLMVKVPSPVRPVFSQIAVHLEGGDATRYLRQLLSDSDEDVRLETILNLAEAQRDDFLPALRFLANGASYTIQECCALAFGELKDHVSINRLKEMADSKQESVRLAATIALYRLGETHYLNSIKLDAQAGSLFAISALGKLKEGKETLFSLLSHQERDVRINAILSLLSLRDARALPYLNEILIEEGKDLGFWRLSSAGETLKAWRTIPSASQQTKAYPGLQEQTLSLRESVLTKCIEFEEEDFLKVAYLILNKKQHTLVPLLVELLQNKKSDAIIKFLKEGFQKAGAPLIRNYCTLALYRLKEEGPYEEQLISWVKAKGGEELIRFKEENSAPRFTHLHQLTPEETSHFLVDACETLASAQNRSGIETLIHTIAYGNPKNRYALAGLLIRTTE